MTSFAITEGIFFTLDEEVDIDIPTAFELTIRGVIHRKGFSGKNIEYWILEWDKDLGELFGEDTPILEFKPLKLNKYVE